MESLETEVEKLKKYFKEKGKGMYLIDLKPKYGFYHDKGLVYTPGANHPRLASVFSGEYKDEKDLGEKSFILVRRDGARIEVPYEAVEGYSKVGRIIEKTDRGYTLKKLANAPQIRKIVNGSVEIIEFEDNIIKTVRIGNVYYHSTLETARQAGISTSTIYTWCRTGKIQGAVRVLVDARDYGTHRVHWGMYIPQEIVQEVVAQLRPENRFVPV